MAIRQINFKIKRLYSTLPLSNGVQHLKERTLIEVKGPDATSFLQGLITNDINHVRGTVGNMFTMFLNTKGRVLYDSLIYKTDNSDTYWIEYDSKAAPALEKHLKMYKVKRKVEISSLDGHQIYVLFNNGVVGQQESESNILSGDYDKQFLPETSSSMNAFNDLLIFKDPRVTQLGFRIISKGKTNMPDTLKSIVQCVDSHNYKKLRYTLGIGEGTDDLLQGSSFPLECNCDYLHGVSFHKGCYIGQELTARTHHTGVVRKRLMPLFFSCVPTSLPENNIIIHNKVNLGKLRGVEGNIGLGLIRISQALEFGNITVGNSTTSVIKPQWWPIELPKEKLNVQTSTT